MCEWSDCIYAWARSRALARTKREREAYPSPSASRKHSGGGCDGIFALPAKKRCSLTSQLVSERKKKTSWKFTARQKSYCHFKLGVHWNVFFIRGQLKVVTYFVLRTIFKCLAPTWVGLRRSVSYFWCDRLHRSWLRMALMKPFVHDAQQQF